MTRYPLDPLLDRGWSMKKLNDLAPCGGGEYRTRRERGVTADVADRMAVAAGFHPYELWPEMLDDHISAYVDRSCAECGSDFTPTAPHQRFCHRRCRDRQGERIRYQRSAAARSRARERRRLYYAENAEYEKARERRRYHERKAV